MSKDPHNNKSADSSTKTGGKSSTNMKNLTEETYHKAKVQEFPKPYFMSMLLNLDSMPGWEVHGVHTQSYDKDLATIVHYYLDSLLLVGVLLAGIVDTFISELRKDTDEDEPYTRNRFILRPEDGFWDPDYFPDIFHALPGRRLTVTLWWLSLFLSLCAISGTIIAKNYISNCSKDSLCGKLTPTALSHRVHVPGIPRWRLDTVLTRLSFTQGLALFLFLLGAVIFGRCDKATVVPFTALSVNTLHHGSRLLSHNQNAFHGVDWRTSSTTIMIVWSTQAFLLKSGRFTVLAAASALFQALANLNKKEFQDLRVMSKEQGILCIKNFVAFWSWCLSKCTRNRTEMGSHQERISGTIADHSPSYFDVICRLVCAWSLSRLTRDPWMLQMKPVSLDLPWKIIAFTKKSVAVPSAGIVNEEVIPDLTGHINIVTGPLFPGGFSDIYSGEFKSRRGTEKVALKMLRIFSNEAYMVKAKKKFRKEVDIWCSLRHPHVLPFYGTCELDEFRIFMVSPWAYGGSSSEYLRCNPFADRNKILLQTASALEYLHSGMHAPPIVHGDLKADNVLISITGDALLADFGLSIHVEEILSLSGSSSGRAGGNPRFMAPELLLPPNNTSDISRPTRESDVFSFACLMLQLFTGQVPFAYLRREGQAILEIANGKLPLRPTDPVVFERGCNDNVWSLMTECWRFNASERPNMTEIRMRMVARGRAVL